jgi:hypothetical protein
MRGEFDALRRVARLATRCVEIQRLEPAGSAAVSGAMQELELALAELRDRFPYTLEFPYTLGGAPSMSESLLGQAAVRNSPAR